MSLRRASLLATRVCGALLFSAGVATAAEGGGSAASRATDLFKWINFATVAVLVLWGFVKKLPVFRAKAGAISSAISKAKAAKEEADRQLADAEARLARLDQEVIALRAVAEKEAAADAERIREMAKSDGEKISLAAKAEIAAAERAARMELKALAAKLAVDGAESLLARQLTPQAQESLIRGFVASLEGRPN
jgi:F-type H+-transporting ATPase subunit b